MKKAQAIACAFTLFFLRAEAQQIYFSKTFDYSQGTEFPKGVAYDAVDNTFITFSSSLSVDNSYKAYELRRYNEQGDTLSIKFYVKPSVFYYSELYNQLHPDVNGGYFSGGTAEYPPDDQNGMLYRFNLNGDTIFTREYTEDSVYEIFYGSTQTLDSGYAFNGASLAFNSYDINDLIVKYDKQGNLQWSKTLGLNTVSDVGLSIVTNSKGHIILGGGRRQGYYSGSWYPWLMEMDDTGLVIKDKVFNYGAWRCGGAVLNKALGDRYLIWSCLDTILNQGDYTYPYYVALLDSDFNLVWRTIFSNVGPNPIYGVKQLADSSIVFVGAETESLYGLPIGWIVKLDKNGNVEWQRKYLVCPTNWNIFADFQQTPDNGFIICGTTFPCDQPDYTQDIWLVKLDSCGYLAPWCCL